jgi:hypothetical protein
MTQVAQNLSDGLDGMWAVKFFLEIVRDPRRQLAGSFQIECDTDFHRYALSVFEFLVQLVRLL